MKSRLVLTVYTDIKNEEEVIDRLTKIVKEHGGTWLESKFPSLLSGDIVGMVQIEIEQRFENVFFAHLDALRADKLYVDAIPYVEHVEQISSMVYVDFAALDKPHTMKNLAQSLKSNNIKVSDFKAKRIKENNNEVPVLKASFTADLPCDMTDFDLEQLLKKSKGVLTASVN